MTMPEIAPADSLEGCGCGVGVLEAVVEVGEVDAVVVAVTVAVEAAVELVVGVPASALKVWPGTSMIVSSLIYAS